MSEEQENVSIKQTEKIILIIIEVIAVLAAIIFFTFPKFSQEIEKKGTSIGEERAIVKR